MSITVSAHATVTTTGIDRYLAMVPRIEAVITEFAQKIADTARTLAPVRTGADRDSIKVELEALAATISIGEGLDPIYGVYQELGFHEHHTGRFIIHPALIPAFNEHKAAFLEAIRAAVRG